MDDKELLSLIRKLITEGKFVETDVRIRSLMNAALKDPDSLFTHEMVLSVPQSQTLLGGVIEVERQNSQYRPTSVSEIGPHQFFPRSEKLISVDSTYRTVKEDTIANHLHQLTRRWIQPLTGEHHGVKSIRCFECFISL